MRKTSKYFTYQGRRYYRPEAMRHVYEDNDFHARTLTAAVDVRIYGEACNWRDGRYYLCTDDFKVDNQMVVRGSYHAYNGTQPNDLTFGFALYRLADPDDKSKEMIFPIDDFTYSVIHRDDGLWHFKASRYLSDLPEGEYILLCNGLNMRGPAIGGHPCLHIKLFDSAFSLAQAIEDDKDYKHRPCDDGCWHKIVRFGRDDSDTLSDLIDKMCNQDNDDDDNNVDYDDDDFAHYEETTDDVVDQLRGMSDPDSIEEMKELNEMVGLADFKNYLYQLVCQRQFYRLRSQMGMAGNDDMRYHMILTGNPGTGKTTAAKAIGRMLHRAGVLSDGGVLWRNRTSIVGEYIGETESKMKQLLDEAKGKVLFIDEAYNLFVRDSEKDFGRQALESLLCVTAEADPDIVVVLAGYPEEMDEMVRCNPGIKSRFPLRFNFADFSREELMEIADRLLRKKEFTMTAEARSAFADMADEALKTDKRDFGNARWVHNMLENYILQAMTDRVVKQIQQGKEPTPELMSRIEKDDILAASKMIQKETKATENTVRNRNRIGFAA